MPINKEQRKKIVELLNSVCYTANLYNLETGEVFQDDYNAHQLTQEIIEVVEGDE